jgi:hypothetical protein
VSNFFYKGQYYDTFEEMIQGAKEYNSAITTHESFTHEVSLFVNELQMNLFLRNYKVTNADLCDIFFELIFKFCNLLDEVNAKSSQTSVSKEARSEDTHSP